MTIIKLNTGENTGKKVKKSSEIPDFIDFQEKTWKYRSESIDFMESAH